MRKNILITIQYDGTKYNGWQKQGNTEKTIQGKIENILSKMSGQSIEIHGSGRTDGGVHALGQTANFKLDTDKSADEIMDYINEYLPKDIAVINAQEVNDRLHARLSAKRKTYRYRILVGRIPDVFSEKYVCRHEQNLDIEKMREASSYIIGKHDFLGFCDLKKMKKSSVRTIESIEIYKNGNEIVTDITGDGFLYHMVRLIMGMLIEIGEGKRCPQDMAKPLETLDRQDAGILAPAKGLCLVRVEY